MFKFKNGKMKLGIIINPDAGMSKEAIDNTIDDTVKKIKKICSPFKHDVYISDSFNEIFNIGEKCKLNKYDYLILAGGNGTFHHVISRFKSIFQSEEIPPVLLLKYGHMNTIAESINKSGTNEVLLKKFIKQLKKNKIQIEKRNLIKIDDKYCTIFGAGGLVVKYMNIYYSLGNYKPHNAFEVLTEFMSAIKDPVSVKSKELFTPFKADVEIDDKKWEHDTNIICLGMTIPELGLGFNPGTKALTDENKFQFFCSSLKPVDFIAQIFRFYSGYELKDPLHFDDLVEDLVITADDPFEYTMDGEMYDAIYELRVNVSKKGIRFIKVI